MNSCDIFLTTRCNKNCSFCFVRDKKKSDELAPDDLEKVIIPALQKNNIRHITLLGGEPTIYQALPEAINILIRNGIRYEIFSNGLFDQKIFKHIDLTRVSISVHLPHNEQEKEEIVANMEFLNRKKAFITLRDVITQDYHFSEAVEFIYHKKNLINGIRFKIAQPDLKRTNDYLSDIHMIKKELLLFLKIVDKMNIAISNCCFLPFCEFSESELAFLKEVNYLSHCRRVFYIDTDLSIKMCPFHNDVFCQIGDLDKVIKNRDKIKFPMYDKCLKCKYYVSDECVPCFSGCHITPRDMIDACGLNA